mgnify:CR=1 FL=1
MHEHMFPALKILFSTKFLFSYCYFTPKLHSSGKKSVENLVMLTSSFSRFLSWNNFSAPTRCSNYWAGVSLLPNWSSAIAGREWFSAFGEEEEEGWSFLCVSLSVPGKQRKRKTRWFLSLFSRPTMQKEWRKCSGCFLSCLSRLVLAKSECWLLNISCKRTSSCTHSFFFFFYCYSKI